MDRNISTDLTELVISSADSIRDFVTAVTPPQGAIVVLGEEDDMKAEVTEKSVADDLHFVMSAVIGPIICLFGMAGNLLSVITWSRPGMGSSTGRYLMGQV